MKKQSYLCVLTRHFPVLLGPIRSSAAKKGDNQTRKNAVTWDSVGRLEGSPMILNTMAITTNNSVRAEYNMTILYRKLRRPELSLGRIVEGRLLGMLGFCDGNV